MQSDPRQRLLEFLQQHDDVSRISIIAEIMHNLTIMGRSAGLDLSRERFRQAMLGLNEIQHSLSSSLGVLCSKAEFSCEFCAGTIFDKAQGYGISGPVGYEVTRALDRRARELPVI